MIKILAWNDYFFAKMFHILYRQMFLASRGNKATIFSRRVGEYFTVVKNAR